MRLVKQSHEKMIDEPLFCLNFAGVVATLLLVTQSERTIFNIY